MIQISSGDCLCREKDICHQRKISLLSDAMIYVCEYAKMGKQGAGVTKAMFADFSFTDDLVFLCFF